MTDPKTLDEWQVAVDLAKVCLLIHNARLQGLVFSGLGLNVNRALSILNRGRNRGIRPRNTETLIRDVLPSMLMDLADADEERPHD
jgi:hypothetical protein